jgi:hypothetical protein
MGTGIGARNYIFGSKLGSRRIPGKKWHSIPPERTIVFYSWSSLNGKTRKQTNPIWWGK